MIPYQIDPAWFDSRWYGTPQREAAPRQSYVPGLIVLGASVVLTMFTMLGGFGPVAG